MEEAINAAIRRQAKKILERQKREQFSGAKYRRRFKLRTGETPILPTQKVPHVWGMHPHFNPKYCISHSKYLSKHIWRKIQSREYTVTPAILFEIPKDSGGHRDIMSFSIPDAAVSNLFNQKMRDRNKNLQSPFCYSYRKDRSIFDAILQTSSILKDEKCFTIQYDFRSYFDSIRHDYLRFIMDESEILISPAEKFVINEFLKHRFARADKYSLSDFETRETGVPQGSSLSLFLSNLAAHELDKKLEKANGSFVRFADDIVCTTKQFGEALEIKEIFEEHCRYSGIQINLDKSPGIALLLDPSQEKNQRHFIDHQDIGEISAIREFDYIGHKFSSNEVGISDRGISRIKARIGKIIHIHLLSNPNRGLFESDRVGRKYRDWDLVTCINEIRRYIYGGLRESQLSAFIDENERISKFKGLMSFYPLVTNVQQFADLDGWILSVLLRAMRQRRSILKTKFKIKNRTLGKEISKEELISGKWYKFDSGFELETNAPSFVLAWRAARKAFRQYGLSDFEAPGYYSTAFMEY